MIVAAAGFVSVVIVSSSHSSLERRLQVLAFAFPETDRDAQALEVLIDYLAAETHAMLAKKILHLVLPIEQRNDRLAHSRQRVVGIFLNHLVPMRARKVPRLVTARGVEQQRMHQVRRILRSYLSVEGHLHGFSEQLAIAEIRQRKKVA